ncbi:MAG: MarC family protein [Paludibacteraceae bacterium]|nr:MarC family protein [Paludibacteraceae bacterium]
MSNFFGTVDGWQIISAFIFLIAIIDPFGNMPITISMQKQGATIHPIRVCIYSTLILCTFLLMGDIVMKIFGVKPEYFAIAGGFVIFLMALEMLLDVVIFKMSDLGASGDLVPLAFPMYAGPGAFTAMLSLTTDYNVINLLIAIGICMLFLYIVLAGTNWLTQYLKPVSLYIIRKFFGVIVLAIAVQLMFGNLVKVFHRDETPVAPVITTETVDAVSGNFETIGF